MSDGEICRDALIAFIATPEGKPLMASMVAGATFLRIVGEACAKARAEGEAAGEAEGSPFSPDNMLAVFKGQRKP